MYALKGWVGGRWRISKKTMLRILKFFFFVVFFQDAGTDSDDESK